MRTIAALALAISLSFSATAAEVSVKLDDSAQSAVAQLPGLLDQCVSGVMLRGDATICKSISNFLLAFVNETKTAQAATAAKAAVDTRAADEARKASEKPAESN